VVWPASDVPNGPVPPNAVRSGMRTTADGAFATDRWKPGDKVRERFTVTLGADWKADRIVRGLVADVQGADKARPSGATPPNDPTIAILGSLPLAPQAGSQSPPRP